MGDVINLNENCIICGNSTEDKNSMYGLIYIIISGDEND